MNAASPPGDGAPSATGTAHSATATPPILLITGVSGSGKTTIGSLLAGRLGWEYAEADSFHPAANIAKMSAGHPLTDDDRWPWLDNIGHWIDETTAKGRPGVVTSSALKRVYRERIRSQAPSALFLHLDGTVEVLTRRIEGRSGHFMPAALLESQIETLEPLAQEEGGYVLNIDQPVADMVDDAVTRLRALVAAQS